MEETVTKRTTLCYCQNVYLITFATLCLLFFCAYFIFYSYIAICDPQIEYKSFQDVCAAKNTTRALKMQQPLGTTWVQTVTIAVDCVYMFLLILYNFYCKADFTVLPQIADRTWEKKITKMLMTTCKCPLIVSNYSILVKEVFLFQKIFDKDDLHSCN